MKLFLSAAIALILMPICARAVPVTLRVADAQGRPIAGADVEYADYAEMTDEKPNVGQFAKTAANGTIALDLRGVSGRAGEVIFQSNGKNVLGSARVRDAKLGYANAALVAGENTLTLQQTARVAGTIRGADGAPLAGAKVTFIGVETSDKNYENSSSNYGKTPIVGLTDDAGRWQIADLPFGYAQFWVSASGAANEDLNFWIDKAEVTAPDLKLRAAGSVRGRILDFGGRPVPSVTVYLSDNSGAIAKSDSTGRFTLSGVPLGEVALEFNSSAPNWTGVSAEINATIPAQNAVVDIGDVRADEGVLVTGLVVDSVTKAPIANVKLKLNTWDSVLQTDAKGRFETRVQKQFYGLKVLGDYNLKTEVPWSPDDAKEYDVGTIEVERIGATFSGRVTDDNGVAVAGVRVGANRTNQFEWITPDVKGNFKIENLPYKPLLIRASDGLSVAETAATPGVPILLKLPPATVIAADDIEKLWDGLNIKRVSDLDRYFEALGNRRVFDVAKRLDANVNSLQIGAGLSDYIQKRAQMARTPAEREAVASNAYELVRTLDMRGFNGGMAQVAILAARTPDAELREWAARWYETQKARVKPLDSPDKIEWYDEARTEWVMQVGAALGRADATKYRDIWLKQIDKPNNPSIKQLLPDWGESLWLAEPKWFDEIVGQWPAPEQMRAIVGALKVENDAVKAKALLARLENLASDPAVIAVDATTTDSMGPISASAQNLYQGRTNYARSMALVDAPSALDALDKVQAVIQSGETYQIAATIARAALANGQTDIARRALRFGLTDRYADGSGALALIARPFDADLAAQLMEVARVNSLGNNSPFEPAGWADVAAYAVALREFDAGAGRLLLEDQWDKRQHPPANPRFDEQYERQRLIEGQEKLAWAMAFYDVGRALQWLSEIKDDRNETNNGIERTRLAIVVAALTPPSRRSFLLGATYFG